MGGVRISGTGLAVAPEPILPMLSADDASGGDHVIWEIGNLATPVRVNSTAFGYGDNDIADPFASPLVDGNGVPTEFVYALIASASGSFNTVQRPDWDDVSNPTIAQAPSAPLGGSTISTMPSYSPDGQTVVYRDTSASISDPTIGQTIWSVSRDGSGDTLLYDPADSTYKLYNPMFSPDGNYIAFTSAQTYLPTPITTALKYRVHVMEADGSNHTVIVGPYNGGTSDSIPLLAPTVSWMHGSNVLAYLHPTSGTSFTADWEWHKINFDGTGDTTLLTINRAGYTVNDIDPGPNYSCWLTDDSAVITALIDIGTGIHELTAIDAGGGGATGLGVFIDWSPFASDLCSPLVYQQRIYYPVGPVGSQTLVESVDEAAADLRTDFDGTIYDPGNDVRFQGFRGTAS